jgi:NAD(P)H-dependent nitrite reductase small subunit
MQIAVFRFESRGEWYATQNVCPHKRSLVLSQGIVGDAGGIPKVACPVHKKPFGLRDGRCLSGEDYRVATFPVRVESGQVYVELPAAEALDPLLGTAVVRVGSPRGETHDLVSA